MNALPLRVDRLYGRVRRGAVGEGSKSARDALWIDTVQGSYLLRFKDGPSFGETALDRWVGQQVACSGFIVAATLLAERIEGDEGT
jgi:hypothetical protein